jgi:Tol biopolymer transport system component
LDSPAWSPDGEKIAFARGTALDTSSVDSSASASAPAEGLAGIYLINVDGTGLRKLTSLAEDPFFQEGGGPVWSPDGEKIAFYDNGAINGAINVINADGSGRKSLTNTELVEAFPTWSPDGEKIAFTSFRYGYEHSRALYVINANGSDRTRLATDVGETVSWGSG